MLQLTDLCIPDLDPLSLSVQPGRIVGLSGPSGSGKTRLLRALADLDPHQGSVSLDGRAQSATPAHQWRRKVMLLPAESQWWCDRVAEHFSQGRVEHWQSLGFEADPSDWSVDRLSSGEKQRLALLRALAYRPRVLLLDEPTANLDEVSRDRAEQWLLNEIRKSGLMAIWVAHDRAQLERVADQRLGLDHSHWRYSA